MTDKASEFQLLQEDANLDQTSLSLSQSPINFYFNTVAYNGTKWLGGSIDIVRTKNVNTYPAVKELLDSYYDYSTLIKIVNGCISYLNYENNRTGLSSYAEDLKYLNMRKKSAELLKNISLSQATSTFKNLRDTLKIRIGTTLVPVIQENGRVKFEEQGGWLVPGGLVNYTYKTLHTLAKSDDGISWKLIEANPFQPEVRVTSNTFQVDTAKAGVVNGIAWNSTLSLWVAVGGRGVDKWNKNQYGGSFSKSNSLTQISSSDLSGYINGQFFYTDSQNQNAFTESVPDSTIIATSPDGEEWTQYAISPYNANNQILAYGVACSSNLTVVVGKNFNKSIAGAQVVAGTVLTSTDCKTWNGIVLQHQVNETTYIGMKEAYGVAYNGNLWVVVGRGYAGNELATSIYTSSNGTTWTHRTIPSKPVGTGTTGDDSYNPSFRLNSVAWNGSIWLAVGTLLSVYISEDGGFNWTLLDKPFFNGNIVEGFEQSIYEFSSVAWDGNYWIITGFNGTYRSKDTIVWEKVVRYGGKSIATTIPLPILGGAIQTTNSILVGKGSPASILRSNDNLKWYPQIFDVTQTNYLGNRQKEYFDVVWTGNYWIVVGDPSVGNYNNNIARSADGIEWTFPSNELVRCRGIAWNGSKLVVIGERSVGHQIIDASSTNEGETWTSGNLNTVLGIANCIACNGNFWLAGGYRGIAKSTDGSSWTLVNVCPLETVNSIAWNGYVWIAVGIGKSHTIALSVNGTYWYIANPNTNPFTLGNGIAWNKKRWIAVGDSQTDTIATSIDGYTWTGLENTIFGISGKTVSWTGTNWIATGTGNNAFATSLDGLSWTRYDLPIERLNRFANKTISLPFTGVDNPAVLSAVNTGSATITASTNSTIADEEAAIKLAQDAAAAAAAAAAEAATRSSAKTTAANYRVKFLYWKAKIEDEISLIFNNSFGINLKDLYPVEYILSKSIYDKLVEFTNDVDYFCGRIRDPTSSLEDIAVNLQQLTTFDSSLTTDLLQFYNNSRVLFKNKINAEYAKYVTDSDIITTLDNYGFSTQDKTSVINDYNSAKTTYETARTAALSILNTEVTSISYSFGLTYPTSFYTPDDIFTFGIKQQYLNVKPNYTITKLYDNVTTNAPNLYSTYTSANIVPVAAIVEAFNTNLPYKTQADDYYSNTIEIAQKWADVTGGQLPLEEINQQFIPLYNKYFYITDFPYAYEITDIFNVKKYGIPTGLKYFKIVHEDYVHPSQYDTELNTLYSTLKQKLDSLETTRITAINYARNLQNTTVKNKLTEFFNTTKTQYTASLGIDTHIKYLCDLTYYSDSNFIRANNFAQLVRVGSKVYPQLYPFIRAIKLADAEAEDDGATPPSTGWGGFANDGGNVTNVEQLDDFRVKIYTSSYKIKVGAKITFLQTVTIADLNVSPPNNVVSSTINQYNNSAQYTVDETGLGYFVINPSQSTLTETSFLTFNQITDNTGFRTTKNLLWNFNLPANERGKQGLSGWNKYNETYYARQRLADHIREHGGNTGGLFYLVDGEIISGVLWKDFLNFTETFTYQMLADSITDLTTVVNNLNSNSAFAQSTMNSIASQDVSDIQTQVIPAATSYLAGLLTSTTENLPSENDITLFGSVSVNGSPTLASMTNSINTAYDSLTTAATVSLTGKTNLQIQTIIENAISYKETINAIQESAEYIYILQGIDTYKANLERANTHIDLMEEHLQRWTRMKATAIQQTPYLSSGLSDGSGKYFIAGVSPDNTTYWTRRTYTTFYNPDTQEFQECTFNQQANKIVTLPALTSSDYTAYSSSTTYVLGDLVKFNDKIYECIKDGSSEYLNNVLNNINSDTTTSLFIQGVDPTDSARWKRRRYPYVTFNGSQIEADPSIAKRLTPTDYEAYTPTYSYREGSIVSSENTKIYLCINDITNSHRIKGVIPTNTNYWKAVTYPIVVYNDVQVEASPTNLPALSLSNYEEYSSTKTYYKGNFVKQNSNIYELVEFTTNDSSGKPVLTSTGSPPSTNANNRWVQRTYPVVYVNGVKTEATPGTFAALNINNYSTYSDSTYYYVGDYIKYNNVIYTCTLQTRSSLIGIPVSNTEYWREIRYPTVLYNGKYVELLPGAIPALNPSEFKAYNRVTRYFAGDVVSHVVNVTVNNVTTPENRIYECINGIPYGIGIKNTQPTSTYYWKERKYPYVVVEGELIEADPDSGRFVALNHLDVHKYSSGFLYYLGDLASYNGYVYECTNTAPPTIQTTTISNTIPTNATYWTKLDYTLESNYNIVHWFPTTSYEVGTVVNYDGKIYRCETRNLNIKPTQIGINWKEITDYTTLTPPVPPLYSPTTQYSIGSLISYRQVGTDLPNNETHKLNFYYCSATEPARPVRLTYDKLYITDETDEFGDYIYKIQSGNWLEGSIPKYGLPEDDPFKIPMFAVNIRRRVAMDIELPYEYIKTNVYLFPYRFKQYYKNLLTESDVIPSNAMTTYNALETRGTTVCTQFTTLEASPNMNVYEIVAKAYKQITDYLATTKTQIQGYISKINTMKTQYFNNPGVQQQIYDNPYKFMNPVAFAQTPPKKQFKDLGFGDIQEMEGEVYNGNQMHYTMENIRMYYANTNITDTLVEEISKLLIQAKCITGFNVLFKIKQSQNTKLGARFLCLLDGYDEDGHAKSLSMSRTAVGPYIAFDIPITDYDIYTKWTESPAYSGSIDLPKDNTIVGLINDLMKETVKPPEYCIGPSDLLAALTYESKNKALNGLAAVAKGLVGLTAAGFRNFVDPWQAFGAIEFIGQAITGDFNKKILTFIPEGNWPKFNERAGDIKAFKELVNIERNNIKNSKDEYDATTLAQFLETVGKLLRMNQYDLDDLNNLKDPEDIVVTRRTVTDTVVIPKKPNPPAGYVDPPPPEAPELKTTQCKALLVSEREQLRAMRRNLEQRLFALKGGAPNPSKYYVSIPEATYQETKAVISDKKYKFEIKGLDAAASASRQIGRERVTKLGIWSSSMPSGSIVPVEQQLGPTMKPVNADDINNATKLRETRRAELKQAIQEHRAKQAERLMLISQIEDTRLSELKMTSAIEEVDFKNALVEAENDAVTKGYQKELTDHQEYMESLREKRALAEEKYQKALNEYESKIRRFPKDAASISADLEKTKLSVTQVLNDIADGEEVLVVRRTTYEARIMQSPPMKSLMSRIMPANLIASYDRIVNKANTLMDNTEKRLQRIFNAAVAPFASAAREAMKFLDNRPNLKPFATALRNINGKLVAAKPKLTAALGPALEIVGIGIQAWQDGAFEASERLED